MSQLIDSVVTEIADLIQPEKIILFSTKKDLLGSVNSFKLCVILQNGNPSEIEHKIYLEVECEISYDLVVYTKSQFENLCSDFDSFANKINRSGRVVYG